LPSDKLRLLDPLDVQVPGNGLGFTDFQKAPPVTRQEIRLNRQWLDTLHSDCSI
jgi:hypothetical protein